MANSPQARKRARQNTTRRNRNMADRSRLRTWVKKVNQAIEAGEVESARELFTNMQSVLDSSARKGLIHKNKAARLKSRIVAHMKQAAA